MNLATELERDLDWREAELASFKRVVSASPEGSVRHVALLRAMLAFLYAHFEGFCLMAWDLYLEAIHDSKVVCGDLKPPLVCLSVEQDFRSLRGDTSSSSLWDFCTNVYPSLLTSVAEFPVRLETKSNLWPDLYCRNMKKAGLPIGLMAEHIPRIRSLVSRRNDIAHGQKVGLRNLAEYQPYEEAVLLIMYDLAVAILETIKAEDFRK